MSATLIVPSLRPVPGYAGNKIDHLSRLAKVEGQVRDIARMVDEHRTPSTVHSRMVRNLRISKVAPFLPVRGWR